MRDGKDQGPTTQVTHLRLNQPFSFWSAGSDGFMAEHLKFAGESAITWLKNIMNGIIIVELESIPDVLKSVS